MSDLEIANKRQFILKIFACTCTCNETVMLDMGWVSSTFAKKCCHHLPSYLCTVQSMADYCIRQRWEALSCWSCMEVRVDAVTCLKQMIFTQLRGEDRKSREFGTPTRYKASDWVHSQICSSITCCSLSQNTLLCPWFLSKCKIFIDTCRNSVGPCLVQK